MGHRRRRSGIGKYHRPPQRHSGPFPGVILERLNVDKGTILSMVRGFYNADVPVSTKLFHENKSPSLKCFENVLGPSKKYGILGPDSQGMLGVLPDHFSFTDEFYDGSFYELVTFSKKGHQGLMVAGYFEPPLGYRLTSTNKDDTPVRSLVRYVLLDKR